MEKETDKSERLPHPIAEKLDVAIRQRLSDRQEEKGLSDQALGERAYLPLGYGDVQKKINNLMRGKTGMKLSDFYIVCEALELPPDRVFSSVLDSVLSQTGQSASTVQPSKNSARESQEAYNGSAQSATSGEHQPRTDAG